MLLHNNYISMYLLIKVKEFIPSLNSSLGSESTKTIPFSKDMITGYTLTLIVHGILINYDIIFYNLI